MDIMELLDRMEHFMNVNTSFDFTPDGITMHFLILIAMLRHRSILMA